MLICVQSGRCSCMCVPAGEMKNWGHRRCRPTLRDSGLFVSVKQPPFNADPTSSLSGSHWPLSPPCIHVFVRACVHSLWPNQSTKDPLLIALLSVHLSTCLLVLVISLTLNKLKLITATFQWKWGGRSTLGRKVGGVVNRERGWVKEKVRKGKEAWNPMMGSAQHPEDYSSIHQCRVRQHSWSTQRIFQNEISSSGKKTEVLFIRWLWHESKQRLCWIYFTTEIKWKKI